MVAPGDEVMGAAYGFPSAIEGRGRRWLAAGTLLRGDGTVSCRAAAAPPLAGGGGKVFNEARGLFKGW